MPKEKERLWQDWSQDYIVDSENSGVELFETNENEEVKTYDYGKDDRKVLKRNNKLKSYLKEKLKSISEPPTSGNHEGILYILHEKKGKKIIPRYIGKVGCFKENKNEASSNLVTSDSTLMRWGYGDAYHLGKLSNTVFERDSSQHEKWVEALFRKENGDFTRELKNNVYLWAKAWHIDDKGPYRTPESYLSEVEAKLISVAFPVFPDKLLNSKVVSNHPEGLKELRDWN